MEKFFELFYLFSRHGRPLLAQYCKSECAGTSLSLPPHLPSHFPGPLMHVPGFVCACTCVDVPVGCSNHCSEKNGEVFKDNYRCVYFCFSFYKCLLHIFCSSVCGACILRLLCFLGRLTLIM